MTAPVFASLNVLDKGIDYLKTKCNSVVLVDYPYAVGDSYAVVRGTADVNIIAQKTGIIPTDIVLANQGTNGRKATIPTSTNTALKTSSGTTGYLKFVALDTIGTEVLAVWDVVTDQVITVGNPVLFPDMPYNQNQPTG